MRSLLFKTKDLKHPISLLSVAAAGLLYLLSLTALAQAPNSLATEIARVLEQRVRDTIGGQVAPEQFLVVVTVSGVGDDIAPTEAAGTADETLLPYTPLKTRMAELKKVMAGGVSQSVFEKNLANATYDIELYFDTTVPQEKADLIVKKVRFALAIDEQKQRNLKTSSIVLVAKEVAEVKDESQNQVELAKLENERTRIELERVKFDASKKESDLRDQIKKEAEAKEQIQKKAEEQAKEQAKVPVKTDDQAKIPVEPPKSTMDLAKDFQLLMVAIIGGVLLLVGIFIASGSHKKGLGGLSEALSKMGESIGNAGSAGKDAAVEDKTESESKAPEQSNEATVSSESTAPVERSERFLQFLQLVEEKIDVLSNEGNYNFYRYFIDMVDDNPRFAAAILVSVSTTTAKKLVDNISIETMSKIREILGEPGALAAAQAQRESALQEFYGMIAIDEYMDSPIVGLKNVGWLTQLSTAELRKLALSLDDNLRKDFLACFTPSRLALILDSATDSKEKDTLITAIKTLDDATGANLEKQFVEIHKKHIEITTGQLEKVKKLIDGPRFYAKIISDLKPENRELFVKALSDRHDLLEGIRQYYIPFDAVAKLSLENRRQIFSKRPSTQIAKMIFNCAQLVRDAVVEAMPEMLRDTVREDVEAMVADKSNEKKLVQEAVMLQDEICKFMLKLNKEGLLDFGTVEASSNNNAGKTSNAA